MISEQVVEAINQQINRELFSEYLYLSMSSYFRSMNMNGFENFFLVQIQEERFHAMKMYNFINNLDGRVIFTEIGTPKTNFASPLEVFELAYEHEKTISDSIRGIMNLAKSLSDYATINHFSWFIDEQIEEESSMKMIIQNLKLINGDGLGLILMDKDFAKRSFIPPV